MYTTTKRPFTIFLYDRAENGETSHAVKAAEIAARDFPYIHIGGVYVDNADDTENRPAFDEMMSDCYDIPVDCIAVKAEDRILGNADVTCETIKAFAERGIDVLELGTGRYINYESIWDDMVEFAKKVIAYENK